MKSSSVQRRQVTLLFWPALLLLFLGIIVINFNSVRGLFSRAAGPNTTSKSYLKSNFFKDDHVAASILSGKNYLLQENNLVITLQSGEEKMNPASFEFKLLNAFRQLGFSRITYTQSGEETRANASLHRFQKMNNLPIVDFLDESAMQKIDEYLFQREQIDEDDSQQYSPLEKFIPSPINEPPNEHLAALFYNFFSSLPSSTFEPVLTIDDFRTSLLYGLGGNLGVMMDQDGTRVLSVPEMIEIVTTKGDFKYLSS